MDFEHSLNTLDLDTSRSQLTRALYWKTRELETAEEEDLDRIEEEIADILQELQDLDDYLYSSKEQE